MKIIIGFVIVGLIAIKIARSRKSQQIQHLEDCEPFPKEE